MKNPLTAEFEPETCNSSVIRLILVLLLIDGNDLYYVQMFYEFQ